MYLMTAVSHSVGPGTSGLEIDGLNADSRFNPMNCDAPHSVGGIKLMDHGGDSTRCSCPTIG